MPRITIEELPILENLSEQDTKGIFGGTLYSSLPDDSGDSPSEAFASEEESTEYKNPWGVKFSPAQEREFRTKTA